jgi:Spy/CpxP family protein refolding chaperone
MKKHILTVTAAALLAIPTFSFAEDKPAGDKPAGDKPAGERPGGRQGGGPGGARMTPEERLKTMTEKLSLTQEQQDKIKAIYAKNGDSMKAAREKGFQNLSEEERTKMRDAMKTQNDEIVAVLTPEQQEKYKAMAPQRRGPRPDGDKPKQ